MTADFTSSLGYGIPPIPLSPCVGEGINLEEELTFAIWIPVCVATKRTVLKQKMCRLP
jgi:hypothetical protein